LASDGWLIARRDGRRSEYRLSPVGLDRFAEATRRIYGEIPSSWDRQWTLLLLPPGVGGRRQDLRDGLRWLGFGQISPGVFAHPNWSVEEARAALGGMDGASQALLLKSESEGSDADHHLVAAGWDLGELTRRYRKFVETFTPVLDSVSRARIGPAPTREAGHAKAYANRAVSLMPNGTGSADRTLTADSTGSSDCIATADGAGSTDCPDTADSSDLTPEAAFVVRTLLIHEYRKIHLQDPLLPPALLPSDWVGATAYELTRRLYTAVFPAAEQYLSDTASTMTDPLPPADRSAHARFGGLAV
jgi:phenylacetic acid degradation operon negative regulatory protein